jgi:hypothetical protein
MIRLRNTAPAVNFRADLPAWMEPKGAAYIEIDARPAGRINNAFMAGMEAAQFAHRIAEGADDRAKQEFGKATFAVVYDTCVLEWRTNLINDETGEALTCDRDTFLELADVRVAEVSRAFMDFYSALMDAGKRAIEDTEATVKN